VSPQEVGAIRQPLDLWSPRLDTPGYQRFSGATEWPGAGEPSFPCLDPDGWLVRLRQRSRCRNQRKLGCSESGCLAVVRTRNEKNEVQNKGISAHTWPEPS